jgi:carboxymethylenebutenolidase
MKYSHPPGYLSLPKSGKGAGILVLHAWWGLNPFFKDFCDCLANEGYVTFAPDLYQGKVATTIEEAKRLRSKMKQQKAYLDLLGVIDYLHSLEAVTSKTIGIIGFSLGARFALELSTERTKRIDPVVTFYGTSNVDYSSSQANYLGHFAEKDEWVAISGVKKLEKILRAANRPVTFHVYEGTTHWFFEKDRKEAYNAQSAQLAWKRTVDFLELHLKG